MDAIKVVYDWLTDEFLKDDKGFTYGDQLGFPSNVRDNADSDPYDAVGATEFISDAWAVANVLDEDGQAEWDKVTEWAAEDETAEDHDYDSEYADALADSILRMFGSCGQFDLMCAAYEGLGSRKFAEAAEDAPHGEIIDSILYWAGVVNDLPTPF